MTTIHCVAFAAAFALLAVPACKGDKPNAAPAASATPSASVALAQLSASAAPATRPNVRAARLQRRRRLFLPHVRLQGY